MAKKGGNPQNFNNPPKTCQEPLYVRLKNKEADDFVRSLPNRAEWLRKVIEDAYQRETKDRYAN